MLEGVYTSLEFIGAQPSVVMSILGRVSISGRGGSVGGGSVGSGSVGAGSVGAGSVGAGSVGAGSVGVGSVGSGSVGSGSVGAGSVGAGSVGAGSVGAGSVGSSVEGVVGTVKDISVFISVPLSQATRGAISVNNKHRQIHRDSRFLYFSIKTSLFNDYLYTFYKRKNVLSSMGRVSIAICGKL